MRRSRVEDEVLLEGLEWFGGGDISLDEEVLKSLIMRLLTSPSSKRVRDGLRAAEGLGGDKLSRWSAGWGKVCEVVYEDAGRRGLKKGKKGEDGVREDGLRVVRQVLGVKGWAERVRGGAWEELVRGGVEGEGGWRWQGVKEMLG